MSTIVLAALWVLSAPANAWADIASGGGYIEDGTPTATVEVSATRGGERGADTALGADGGGGGGSSRCRYEPLNVPPGTRISEPDGSTRATSGPGSWYAETCIGPGGQETSFSTVFLPSGTPASVTQVVDPAALAQHALARLPLSRPKLATSPPAGRDQLVNLPTWLWIADAWTSRSASASLGGVTVTVTATPQSVVWDMGTGDRVTCDGPGTPYDPTVPSDAQATDCSYTYRRSSVGQPGERFPVSAELRWRARWTAEGVAGGGDLGTVTRSTGLALRVAEAQALVTDGGSTPGG